MNAAHTTIEFSKTVTMMREINGQGVITTHKHGDLASVLSVVAAGEEILVKGHQRPATVNKWLAAVESLGFTRSVVLFDETETIGSNNPITLRTFRIKFTRV